VTASPTSADPVEGLLSNVSAVLIAGANEGSSNDFALCLESLFEDVVVIPGAGTDEHSGEGALRVLVRALSAARDGRVLVVDPDAPNPTPHLWLALTAWPEHEVVSPRVPRNETAPCALYRRDAVLAAVLDRLRAAESGAIRLAEGRAEELRGVALGLDCDFIEGADLEALREDAT
jgi:molybdopterin-guanine dinucleotide biosynthesis protein A